ncbi:Clp protease N-terminal domain-containing protein [Streptomyces sp. NPDC005322]|uniref:Clp protease N-terminal domain-containing protein n=1 Tax=Streptomyces sp. NPDC005322 TaxID=3157032 RepID=UPI0033A27F2B
MLAQEAARTYKHDFIGTEHILLGLLGEPRGDIRAITPPSGTRSATRRRIPPLRRAP